jgi:hypothetical protein
MDDANETVGEEESVVTYLNVIRSSVCLENHKNFQNWPFPGQNSSWTPQEYRSGTSMPSQLAMTSRGQRSYNQVMKRSLLNKAVMLERGERETRVQVMCRILIVSFV